MSKTLERWEKKYKNLSIVKAYEKGFECDIEIIGGEYLKSVFNGRLNGKEREELIWGGLCWTTGLFWHGERIGLSHH